MTKHTTQPLQPELPFDEIEYGYCHCGCGHKTNPNRNAKGEPYRFVQHHGSRKSPYPPPNPSGECQCGCGQKTEIANQTRVARGWIRGQPKRFVQGHNNTATRPLKEDFWSRVKIRRGPDECWEWQGSKTDSGHAQFQHRGKRYGAHRLAYQLTYGPIPKGMFVCHHCDNPSCCNSAHLFLGEIQDNHADMVQKGRQARGETQHNSKLTEDDVRAIRERFAKGESRFYLAETFGVDHTNIWRIVKRKSWKHIP